MSIAQAEPAEQEAEQVLKATGVKGGLVVHVGCGDGKLTATLHVNDSYLVHGLDADPAKIEKARENIRSRGLYGKVSAERWTGDYLPYMDNLVNLVVAEDLGRIPRAEVLRALAPGGVAYIKSAGKWTKTVKPRPAQIDEWTHYLHDATNNAVAKDTRVGPPRHLQWLAKPLYGRSHEIDTSVCAMVSADGRLFYILDEGLTGITDERLPAQWSLVARDAFSGVLLWKRPVPDWGWRQWKKDELQGKDWTTLRGQRIRSPGELPRRLVAEAGRVYVTLGYDAPVTALDAATGRILQTCEGTERTDEILCSDDILVLRLRGASGKSDSVAALRADTGERLWQEPADGILALSLAVGNDCVFFHNNREIVCLDLRTGEQRWRTPSKGAGGGPWSAGATLVVDPDRKIVLFTTPKKLEAFSTRSGESLWTGSGGRGPGVAGPPDLFVADGLLWCAGPDRRYGTSQWLKNEATETVTVKEGLDPLTGKVKRTVEITNLISPGHHFRCYRSKATERYLLWPKRGVEFLDLKSDNHMRHDWLRAPCQLGCMPCNGLLYVPPHQCFCYPGVKLNGFNVLASQVQAPRSMHSRRRLERGPAYGTVVDKVAGSEDWPTYRRDPKRSGSTHCAVPTAMNRLWHAELGGRLTQPVAANGRLYVASVDTHTVMCLDCEDGKRLWSYTAGGRVDSPPTIYKGLALFGSADGWVYCLRADDGRLAWRFRAAPQERRVAAFGQLESAWPVHGSVLVKDGIAYFAAGRSSYLDGGIHVYGLAPPTGEIRHQGRVEGPYPHIGEDIGRPFDMEGTMSDVLVTDGTYLYMQQTVLDAGLKKQQTERTTRLGDREVGRHVFSTAGFLDDSGWNRTFWMYSQRWPGYYIANQSPKAGQLLVCDEATTYAVKCYTQRNRHSPMFFPDTTGYLLFADDNENEPMLFDGTSKHKPMKWLPDVAKAIGHKLDNTAINRDKGTGFTRARPPKWSVWVPVRIRAMVLAKDTLFVAGPPDVLEPDDPLGAFEGRKGGVLRAVSTADGEKLTEYELKSPPVFDGMIAANERLYICTRDGRVLCMGKKR
jgi:outer membrane protein assembly factor BamB